MPTRRPATAAEAKALGHPLRLRILRLCGTGELTNKQLADHLDRDPGTVLHHVRVLVGAGLLEPAPVRTGDSGALEKPYRSTGVSWWLDGPLVGAPEEYAPIQAFQEELAATGPGSIRHASRFVLHLSADDLEELDRRILAVLDDYITTDHTRRAHPAHGGMFILHQL
ncbi:ArsR/SmtB family transcription factor [Actinokineospora inagensis]|uniref:ArsR/SmtB family transcription factor n=1 Tax=Actinokineospora inagensis TaxID=103730 RepID=UPI00040F2D45|nr:winged helix-turn-helix domain-containing protein [Actinokineospora inagensis]